MKTFKTPKGTELPLFQVKRKSKNKKTGLWEDQPPQDYIQVAYRLVWFREENPTWSIETEVNPNFEKQYCISKATIKNENGFLIATAHKFEDVTGFGDYIEKSETSAIGRALALCGYGTQFAPELSEDERLADAPIEKKGSPMSLANPPPPKVKLYDPPAYGDPSNEPSPFDDDVEYAGIGKMLDKLVDEKVGPSPEDKKMAIGKHTGKKFSEIMSTNMDYVDWCKAQLKVSPKPSQAMKDLVDFANYHGSSD